MNENGRNAASAVLVDQGASVAAAFAQSARA
jgi:hypothetical protein